MLLRGIPAGEDLPPLLTAALVTEAAGKPSDFSKPPALAGQRKAAPLEQRMVILGIASLAGEFDLILIHGAG